MSLYLALSMGLAAAYLTIQFAKFFLVLYYLRFFRKRYGHLCCPEGRAFTIMQPIMAGDPALAAILERNVCEHPEASFLWLLDQEDQGAHRITDLLQSKYPQSNIQICVVPPCPENTNPKLYKLHYAREYIGHDSVIVLDDDTFLPRGTAHFLIGGLEEFGLVSGLPCYLHDGRISSCLLAQFVNNNSAMTYLPLASFMQPVTINGMCYSIKSSTIDRLENFQPLLQYLADDLAVSRAVKDLHLPQLQLPYVQYIQTSLRGAGHYMLQMHRWYVFALLLLKNQSLSMNVMIFLLQGLGPFLFIAALLFSLIEFSMYTGFVAGIVLVLRMCMILFLQLRLAGRFHHHGILSFVSEILQPVHLFHALLWNRILWRRRHYRVFANDRFCNVHPGGRA